MSKKLKILWDHVHGIYEWEFSKLGHEMVVYFQNENKPSLTTQRPDLGNIKVVDHSTGTELLKQGWPDIHIIGHPWILQNALKIEPNIPIIAVCHVEKFIIPDEVKDKSFFVFITDGCARRSNMFDLKNKRVIKHGLDIDEYYQYTPTNKRILTVCSNFVKRDALCGFTLWKKLIKGYPYSIYGSTPELTESKLAKSWEDYRTVLQSHQLFLNTTLRSPIPLSLVDAMATGMPIVTTDTMEISQFVVDNESALVGNDERYLVWSIYELYSNDELCNRLGSNARERARQLFSGERFRKEWQEVLDSVISG